MNKTYICIDLKSFYASVECVDRNLNPLTTNLVVADEQRTDKTICLAVSPSLKERGIKGRPRLFEVKQKIKEINLERKKSCKKDLITSSYDDNELKEHNDISCDFIIATPRMKRYIDVSAKIYEIYLRFFSKDDIHVYSIDEVFIDITPYLKSYSLTAYELTSKVINEVLKETKITATAGIGTNLYLAKIAMDIVAKHIKANADGVRIAYLNEMLYRKYLWNHTPLTDFWKVGPGIAKRLEKYDLYTMGDIAKCSLGKVTDYYNEDLLYKEFGINAELLIDHAWGIEPCSMKDIKNYIPSNRCKSLGQVLPSDYSYQKAKIIVKEMAEALAFELFDKQLLTDQIGLYIGYSNGQSEICAHGCLFLPNKSNIASLIQKAALKIFDEKINKQLLVRRVNITAINIINKDEYDACDTYEQLGLFDNENIKEKEKVKNKKEEKIQKAILDIKKKYGKNAVIKALDLKDGATTIERNKQVGGHKG